MTEFNGSLISFRPCSLLLFGNPWKFCAVNITPSSPASWFGECGDEEGAPPCDSTARRSPVTMTQRYGVGGAALPPVLAQRRLPVNPRGRLEMEKPRFVASDDNELFASIFTWWNLLDRVMLTHEPGSRFMAGYVREVQLRRMLQIVRQPNVTTYCEIGMNGGHSVVAMLLANERASAHVFDLMQWNYSRPVNDLLRMTFGERFSMNRGCSHDTLPVWIERTRGTGTTCDMLLVDGGHNLAVVRNDLQLLRAAATRHAKVVVDDIQVAPGAALFELERRGELNVHEQYKFKKRSEHNPCQRKPKGRILACENWGFAVAEYTSGPLHHRSMGAFEQGKC